MPTDPADVPKIITIGQGLWVRQAIDNIAWMDLGEYAIVVDTLEQPELEEEIFGAIRSTVGDNRVRYVLNTHTDYDHVALNAAFQRHGAKIINKQVAAIPTEGRWFEGPLRRVRMIPMPGCHTEEDCAIWVEPDRALFVGDIFGWGLIPLNTNLRADTAKLLTDTYTRLIGFGASVVIPGHGPLATTADLRRWLDYFQWLQEEVAKACAAGLSDKDILRQIDSPEDMRTWWRFLKWKHQDSLTKVLKSIREGWLED
jgi:glyoxylase-like metal-dependent hydrolase (beta-lactamase superfamily II)